MIVVYLCAAAYAVLITSDFLALYQKNTLSLILFIDGIILLTFCTFFAVWKSDVVSVFKQKPIYCIVMAILAVFFLFLFFYSLFFVLPVKETYVGSNDLKLVDTGMYALCRHPGVIWLTLFFLFAWLSVNDRMMLWLGLASTGLDIIYVIVQDIFIFPKTIEGYDEYKKYTPFLIPNAKSIKRAIETREKAREKVTQ